MTTLLDPIPEDEAPNLFGALAIKPCATFGLTEADERAKKSDTAVFGWVTPEQRDAYVAVQEWRKRNPTRPLLEALEQTGVTRHAYRRGRHACEGKDEEAFSFSLGDLIRPGVGILKPQHEKRGRRR